MVETARRTVTLVGAGQTVKLRFGDDHTGFNLMADVEGLGASTVETHTTPKWFGGDHLDHMRAESGEIFLPVHVRGHDPGHVRRLHQTLREVLSPADGWVTVTVHDPVTGVSRERRAVYKSGLETPGWETPVSMTLGVTVQFLEPRAFGTAWEDTTITVAPTMRASAGWTFPHIFSPSIAGTGDPRAGVLRNDGELAAPAKVTFFGPCENPRVWGDEFVAGYRGRLLWDERVTLDGLAVSAVHRAGSGRTRHVPGDLTRDTRLSKLVIPRGQTTLWFDASDTTGTAKATVSFRETYRSLT